MVHARHQDKLLEILGQPAGKFLQDSGSEISTSVSVIDYTIFFVSMFHNLMRQPFTCRTLKNGLSDNF